MKSPWPTKKLDECVKEGLIELKRGEVISEKDIRNCPGKYPVYSSSAQNNGLFGTYGKYMFDEELITWSVDGGGYFFYRPKHKFSVTNVVGILRLHTKDLLYKFVYYYLAWQRNYLEFDYIKKAHPSVIKELYEIAFPPLPIQQKIVKILDAIQEGVGVQEKIIEKTKELKKSLMADLFKYGAPSFRKGRKLKKTEIGEIPEDWKVVRLGDKNYFKLIMGQSPSSGFYNERQEGLPFLQGKAEFGEISPIPFKWCSKPIKIAEKNDILISVRAPVGDVNLADQKYCIGRGLAAIRSREKVIPFYLFNCLRFFKNRILSHGIGSTFQAITKETLENFQIPLPPLPEQQEIAEILQTVDQKIEIEQKKKTLYEELFKTMLNKIMNQDIDVEKINI